MWIGTHQDGDDAFKLLLHQVTDDPVVKIFHRLPLSDTNNNKLLLTVPGVCAHYCPLVTSDFTSVYECVKGTLTPMPSASYSSCSLFNVSSMNSCCSFSLQ